MFRQLIARIKEGKIDYVVFLKSCLKETKVSLFQIERGVAAKEAEIAREGPCLQSLERTASHFLTDSLKQGWSSLSTKDG